MTKNEGQKIADDFHKKHRSLKNNGHEIIVIDHPQDYHEELRGQNVKGFHRAADNDTYIIASEHEHKEDLLKTIKHETYGHYGLNTFPQENKIDILLSVVHLQDTTLKDEWQQVRYDYPDMKEFRQAEEVFCSVASEVTTKPEFKHSFSETLESKKEIQDVAKYIKMTLQTGDAKQLIVPENNDLQFSKYTDKELDMKKITETVNKEWENKLIELEKTGDSSQLMSFHNNEDLWKDNRYEQLVKEKEKIEEPKQDKKILSENFKKITSKAYKNYPEELKQSKIKELNNDIKKKPTYRKS